MTATTKYEIGQLAWIMIGSDHMVRPVEIKIKTAAIYFDGPNNEPRIIYGFHKEEKDRELSYLHENLISATKDELLTRIFQWNAFSY